MIITKQDFVQRLSLSKEISETKLTPAIADALKLDLRPILTEDTLEQLQELASFEVMEWPTETAALLVNTYVERRERVFRAAAAGPLSDPPGVLASTNEWVYEPLHTLWYSYVKPYWLQAAYCRFLPQHGINIEKAGVTVPLDPQNTYQPVSASHRAALQAAADNTAAALQNRLLRFVHEHRTTSTYDTDHACTTTHHHRQPRNIRGV